ncbi:hypothetical protein NG798_27710 [Ancylothrix sp. C2]|uniref:DUF6876 family protein n=1 Tax=Ancylothrix sp. D3o TaxID=2953691 RepID=UPI0021BB622A|nr:DUF6876 family protein [Ancylothrix sp. D3o]MCT7953588.1 hypothetical protein [Ancylothrix sp. D3o]
MLSVEEIQKTLPHFSSTENYYRHILGGFNYTDGVRYVAQSCEAYWLIDAIASYQLKRPLINSEDLQKFQILKLQVNENKSATLTLERDTDQRVFSQYLPYTDFPLPEIKFYLADKVLLLPTEY